MRTGRAEIHPTCRWYKGRLALAQQRQEDTELRRQQHRPGRLDGRVATTRCQMNEWKVT